MRKAVIFDEFASCCPFLNSETDVNNGYGCEYEKNDEVESGEEMARCYCFSCPLGVEAEQEDLEEPTTEIDWDGLCEDGDVSESEYLLVDIGEDASEDEKQSLNSYEKYMHRYDKKWLDDHDIPNSLCD